MGTRNLTIVQLDGEYRVAQYGQWDGYPECGGIEVLEFARRLTDPTYLFGFEDRLMKCRFLTDSEVAAIDADINNGVITNINDVYPQLHRDVGRGILDMILASDNGLALENSIEFAADSLFCEWAWLIDLDTWKFEAYEGFNKKPLDETDRFHFLGNFNYRSIETKYYPIRKVGEWSLDALPSNQEFLDHFKTTEDE